jgi:4-amino-4-deoxy-L-arabinose transferase-like glycosyltransferase
MGSASTIPAPSRVLSRVAEGPLGWVALVLICATVYLPGLFTLPPVDRDESRFAQASRQMFRSGDWAVPMVQDRPRLNKPPLIYWLQSASLAIFGDDNPNTIWVYRIPSALCATAAVLLTWRLGRRMFDPRAAILAAVLLAVCPIVVWDAHQARADQLLLLTVVSTQLCLFRVWKSARSGAGAGFLWPILFWLGLGLGVMAKGPITPMIAACTAATVCLVERRAAWLLALRPLLGVIVLAAVITPWLLRVVEQVGWDRYLAIIRDETIGRSREAKEGHWGPPGYHLLLVSLLFWPGSLFTAAAVIRAWPRAALNRTLQTRAARPHTPRAAELFLLGWLVPSWIIFELIGTKLPHYTMPLYPALALLSARMTLRIASLGGRFVRDRGMTLGIFIWILLSVLLAGLASPAIAVALAHPLVPARDHWLIIPASIAPIIAFAVAGRMFRAVRRHRLLQLQIMGIALALITPMLLIELNLARRPELALSSRLLEQIRRLDPDRTRPVAASVYHEDSLVFLTRGTLRKLDPEPLAAFARENPDAILVVPESQPLPPGFTPASTLTGFNYSIGKWATLVVAVRPSASAPPIGGVP